MDKLGSVKAKNKVSVIVVVADLSYNGKFKIGRVRKMLKST